MPTLIISINFRKDLYLSNENACYFFMPAHILGTEQSHPYSYRHKTDRFLRFLSLKYTPLLDNGMKMGYYMGDKTT